MYIYIYMYIYRMYIQMRFPRGLSAGQLSTR